MWDNWTPTSSGSWASYNITGNKAVPANAIAEILCTHSNSAIDDILGVRTSGSILNRYLNITESESGTAGAVRTTRMLTKVASNGYIEYYCGDSTNVTYYIMGYFKNCDYTEMFQADTAGADANWTVADWFTDYSIPKGSIVEVACCNLLATAARILGVRRSGSSSTRSFDLAEAEPNGPTSCHTYTMMTKTNTTNGCVQLYSEVDADCRFNILGYFNNTINYTESTLTRININAATAGTWSGSDQSGYTDQNGRLIEVEVGHFLGTAGVTVGARGGDSTANRYVTMQETETSLNTNQSFFCLANASGEIDVYTSDGSNDWLNSVGYFVYTPEVLTLTKKRLLFGVGL